MELKVFRKKYTDKTTMGELHLNGTFFCYTLEDVCRDKNHDGDLNDRDETKIYGETAIPFGKYEVKLTMSKRFKVLMPEVQNVPGFEGIRIHYGNQAVDTHGCLLIGATKAPDFVGNSRITFDKLMIRLKAMAKTEDIFITYYDD